MRSHISFASLATLTSYVVFVSAQQNCYFGPGAGFRGPTNLVPCNGSSEAGVSACCLLGDTCLSGSTCYNYATGNLYQYGCTDISYRDESCPKKCGFDFGKSPWIGLEYCTGEPTVADTWTCLAPESCGCEWNGSYALQILPSRACAAMGSEARVALYAPSTLLPYVSLPTLYNGETSYYSTTTDSAGKFSVVSTAIAGYTPSTFTQFTSYSAPQTVAYINPGATASPSTNTPAYVYTDTTPPAVSSAAPPSSPPSAAPTKSSAVTTTAAASSGGLSTGAQVGIGVGVAGGFLFLVALGVFLFIFTRRRKNKTQNQTQQPPAGPPMAPYMQGQAPSGWAPFNPSGMPYYVVPANMVTKDGTVVSISPQYSPPSSPPRSPPPMELPDQTRSTQNAGELNTATSPRAASGEYSDLGAQAYPVYIEPTTASHNAV